MASTPTKESEKHCVLCCQEVDIFALGKCDHPVCYRCSTKMRVLCDQKYCAVCREELDKVVFVKKIEAFAGLPYRRFHCEKKHDIYFSDERIYAQYRHLLSPECPRCPEPKVFSRFEELEQHMRKQHELFCCKLCSKHLKIFSHERKWYNRKELARHRAHGDPDDTSHRGHPLCKFCDDRYLDNDELLKHLRRDHYFCHFCDADGSQEYYSDYRYLSEHFRHSHYLCEEGRCATEQFTHAFRTEIDYKAHKAAEHSKNRAEARQNRQIDLQFNYAPRQPRRNEGLVSSDDYEELRHRRGGQKSWRYSREEEDRAVAAAMRASMVTRRQEERATVVQERSAPKHSREERAAERAEAEDARHRAANNKPAIKPPVRTMKSKDPEEDDFPVLGAAAPAPAPAPAAAAAVAAAVAAAAAAAMVKAAPAPVAAAVSAALKEDDFPSLTSRAVSSPMTPAYSAQPRKTSSFQEEDFPALVSKARPLKAAVRTNSAWSSHAPTAKSATAAAAGPPPPPLSSAPSSGHQPLSSSSSSSSSRRKKKVGDGGRAACARSPPLSDDEGGGLTQQEFRAVPTMLDISSLLTIKGSSSSSSSSKPPTAAATPSPPVQAAAPEPPAPKPGKRKKQKNAEKSAASAAAAATQGVSSASMETAAQKENVPDKTWNKVAPAGPAGPPGGLANGHAEKPPANKKEADAVVSRPNKEPPLPEQEEEEFPALMTKKPPPGFKSSFPTKASALPSPPPGLSPGTTAAKPPPGFTRIPLNSNVVDPAPTAVNPPPKLAGSVYLVPDDFHQRNLQLILSIRKYLNNDESKFNEFKNYSAQFRQGAISASDYHRCCKELLGDDFNRIFNELLVLLPDTAKQQELLTAHGDCKATERQAGGGGGGGKKNRNKKNAWQAPPTAASAAAELDCQVCPTCRQVLAPKDFITHKTLHIRDSEEFPSLQSISRIIS